MQRRSFLRNSALAGAAGAAGLAANFPAPAIAQGKRELSMVMSWPHNFPGLASIAYDYIKFVEAMTDGQITIKLSAAGELVGPFEVFDAVGSGAADLYHAPAVFLFSKWKGSVFFSFLPFGLTATEHCAWMYHGGGQELQNEAYGELFNLVAFTCGQTGVQMAGWFNKEVNSLDDFRGVTMRVPGLGGEVMRRVGASAVMIAPQEIFQSLQAGTIDATELCCAWLDAGNGFHQHAKYYYTPGWQEPNSAGEIGINAELFADLTPQQQAIMQHAAQAANSTNIGAWSYYNAEFMQTLLNEHQVDVRTYPDDVLLALAKASEEVAAELGESDPFSQKIYASWKPYRDRAFEYSALVDAPLYRSRQLVVDAG
ncbi:MAG: TRAP transporter substrate-binding protein [Rhodospirillales bacterium]